MKPNVIRLPVQHKLRPCCPSCDAPLPTYDGTIIFESDEATLLAVTFHVRCKCGAKWDLMKTMKGKT